MQAGKLDKRLRIERKQIVQDPDYGTETITWVPLSTAAVWGQVQEVLPSKSTESQALDIVLAERPARLRLRYRNDITADMRIVHLGRGSRILKIVTPPVEVGKRQWIEIMVADYSTEGGA